jgi:hypothetical protein
VIAPGESGSLRAAAVALDELADAVTGKAPEWVDERVRTVFAVLLYVDPRTKRSLARGRRMKVARDSGATLEEIANSFNCRKSTVCRLLGAVSRDHETVALYRARRSNGG